MNLRSSLLAATILALPVVASAQTSQSYAPAFLDMGARNQPISGIYVGGGLGLNFMQSQNVSTTAGPYSASGKINYNTGFAGKLNVGYGFGNGLRAELEGNYRNNTANGTNPLPLVGNANVHGNEQKYGAMVNALYDFNTISRYVIPYVGVGVGYTAIQEQGLNIYNNGGQGNIAYGNSTKSSFAWQAILGAAFPITPALAITAEYNFFNPVSDRNYAGSANLRAGGTTYTGMGSSKFSGDYNHSLLIGVRYAFGAAPAPVPAAAPAPAPAPARSYLVFFDWDKANLTDRARQIIADAAANSKKVAYTKIESNGYTDTSGTPKYNQGLSVRRAQAVAAELVKDGVPKNAIVITGFGETHPLVPTAANVREPQNRRVEIVIK